MEELERQGKKIPEDVAVTGYDNSLYARQGQGITTITHPQEKLGRSMLIRLMRSQNMFRM